MRGLETNLLDWQKRYGTEEAFAQALMQQRWPGWVPFPSLRS